MRTLMKQVVIVLGLAYLTTANEYSIDIGKTLFNGDPAPETLSVRISEKEQGLNIHVDFTSTATYPQIKSTTVYLANKLKEIWTITFTENNAVVDPYISPYLGNGDGFKSIDNDTFKANAADFDVDYNSLPKDIIAASASFIVTEMDSSETIYNHYGIKNYQISLPDTFIVESYMPVSLPKTSSDSGDDVSE